MNTDILLWSSIQNIKNQNIWLDILLFGLAIFMTFPFWLKTKILSSTGNFFKSNKNIIKFQFSEKYDDEMSIKCKSILEYIKNNPDPKSKIFKELNIIPDSDTASVFQIDQNMEFFITKDIKGKIYYDSVTDYVTDNGREKFKTITVLEVFSYNLPVDRLFKWINKTAEDFEEGICKKLKNHQWIISIHWDINVHNNLAINMKKWQSNLTFENGYFPQKDNIIEKLDFFLNNQDWYEEKGIPYTFGILLHGVPGGGKTSLIKRILNYTERHALTIKLSKDFDFHKLDNIINGNKINTHTNLPADKRVVIFEDIDAMGCEVLRKRDSCSDFEQIDSTKKKSEKSEKNENKKSNDNNLSYFLNMLDGVCETPGRIVIITTNHIEKLDPAILRPGRIDLDIKVDYLEKEDVYNMTKFFWEDIGTFKLSDLRDDIDKKFTCASVINLFRSFETFESVKKELFTSNQP